MNMKKLRAAAHGPDGYGILDRPRPSTIKIYLASRYGRREELVVYKRELERLGYVVTSRWLKGEHRTADRKFRDLRDDDAAFLKLKQKLAREDLEDIFKADCLIAFTEKSKSKYGRGGRHIETGVVLGWNRAILSNFYDESRSRTHLIRLIAVGPCENIFHSLPSIIAVRDWDQAVKKLNRLYS